MMRVTPPERQNPDADLREPESRGRIGDPDVSGESQFEPAAEAVAGDRGDGRLRQTANTSYTDPEPA